MFADAQIEHPHQETRALRLAIYLVASLTVHGVIFGALAATPTQRDADDDRVALVAIEFTTITDRGGGRIGNDDQIGDAPEPAVAPKPTFKRVAPKPKAPPPKKPSEPAENPIAKGVALDSGSAHAAVQTTEGSGAGASQLRGSAGSDPNATMAGTGSGGEGVERRTALRTWLRHVQREVNKIATRDYPERAVRMRLEGKLKLGITIDEHGHITKVRLLSSCGHEVLDEAALSSVDSLRIPAPPPELRWQEREIALPIRYALQ